MNRLRLILAFAATAMIPGAGQAEPPGVTRLAAIGAENPGPELPGAADAEVAPPPEAAPQPARTGNPLWALPLRKLSATRERPLFSPSRRPPAPVIATAPAPAPVVALPPPAPEAPPLALVGTIIGETEKFAILVNLTSNETKRVREGQEEAGWLVREVELRAAIVEKNHRSVTLDLPKRDGKPLSGSAPASTAAPRLAPRVDRTM